MRTQWKKGIAVAMSTLLAAGGILAGAAPRAAATVRSRGGYLNEPDSPDLILDIIGKGLIDEDPADRLEIYNQGHMIVDVRGGLKLYDLHLDSNSIVTLKMGSSADVFTPNATYLKGTLIVELVKGYVPKKKIKIIDGYQSSMGKFKKVRVKGKGKLLNPVITYSAKDSCIYLEGEAKGGVYKRNNETYKITRLSGKKAGEVSQKKMDKNCQKEQYTMKTEISLNGSHYKVTKVGDKGFQQTGKADTIVLGSAVKAIGKDVFGDSVKNLVIKTTKLKKGSVDGKAFNANDKIETITVPKKKLSEYKKLFRSCGLSKSVKFKVQ